MVYSAFIFIFLGILIKHGRMYFLIAGYNTMSPEEQAKYKIEKIAILFRNVMYGIGFIIIIGFLFSLFLENPKIEKYCFFTAMLIGIPYLLLQSNSNKYKHDDILD